MKIHQLRNATFVIESGDYYILIDPMLSEKGDLPPFSWFRHKSRRNPIVPLPDNSKQILERVSHCLITHSNTFGIKALQHTDHLDSAGESFLKEKKIPTVCRVQDSEYLAKYGIQVEAALSYWQPKSFLEGKVTAVPAQHGHG